MNEGWRCSLRGGVQPRAVLTGEQPSEMPPVDEGQKVVYRLDCCVSSLLQGPCCGWVVFFLGWGVQGGIGEDWVWGGDMGGGPCGAACVGAACQPCMLV